MKTLEQYRQEINAAFPFLPQDEQARKAAHKLKADIIKAWLDALIEASTNPQAARRLWEKSFPRGGGSSGLLSARLRKFGSLLVIEGKLNRSQVQEIEANYDNLQAA